MILPSVEPTERLFSPQTVCVWATGVYIARAFNPSIPNTKAEVLALAADSGVPNGASGNYTKLAAGMKKRYGLEGVVYPSLNPAAALSAVLAAAGAGPVAVGVAGDQANLLPAWQPGNHVGHSIAVLYNDGTTGVQLDPLAPAGYQGDPMTPTELGKYIRSAIIFKEEVVVIEREKFTPRAWALKAPATITGHKIDFTTGKITDGLTRSWTTNSSASADETLTMNGKVYIHVVDGAYAGQYISSPNAVLSDPPKTFLQADLDAARAAGVKAAAAAAAAAK